MSEIKKPDLLKGNIYRTILQLGVPLAIASIVQTLYNLADAFWLGKLGRSALSAPVISFNIIFFFISLGMGFSVAGTSLVAQYIGAGDKEKARRVAGNLLVYLSVFACIFVTVSLAGGRHILQMLHTPADAFDQTWIYFRIMVAGIPLAFPVFVYRSVMNGYGDTRSPLRIELISAALNVILDPLLIFGWLGFPAMGVAGAALATAISRGVASAVGMWYFFSGRRGFKISLCHLKLDKKIFPLMMRIGFPASIGMAGASLGFLVLMGIVNRFGTAVVSAYGISNRVVHLFMMPAMGVSQAVTAIVGQSLGAGKRMRAKSAVSRGVRLILAVIVPSMLVTALLGREITGIFIPNDRTVMDIGHTMFHIVSPSVVFFAFSSVLNGAFQGSGHTVPVMVTNLFRIWLFRVPLVYFLALHLLGGPGNISAVQGIWWGMFLSNFMAALMMSFWYLRGRWLVPRVRRDT